ncbi:MAG: heme exporter protein CcmD [Alphaproteobacteria bacterium]|nr:heme exporter protein CcmD [Alphaproteobacteria bacterium]
MSEFLQMGGYARFVWPAYIVSALVIGGLSLAIWRRGRALQRQLSRFDAEGAARPRS